MAEDEKRKRQWWFEVDSQEMKSQQYIEHRVKDSWLYYDQKAIASKKYYYRIRIASLILGAIMPVLINISFGQWDWLAQLIMTSFSVALVILLGLDGILHYRRYWINSRFAQIALETETLHFQTREGLYKRFKKKDALDEKKECYDVNAAFLLFVERIENIISCESVATLAAVSAIDDKKSSDFPPIPLGEESTKT